MRAVRISARRAGKSCMALLGKRAALCDAILEDFVAFKHPRLVIYGQNGKINTNNTLYSLSVQI